MEQFPFNACDYRCEHCLATAECVVFKKLQERIGQDGRGSGDRNDLDAVLAEIRSSFREAEEQIKRKAREFGINIDEIAGGETAERIREEHRCTVDDPLYQRAHEFTLQSRRFLGAAGPYVLGEAKEYLDDIAWHHTVVTAKIYRALGWNTHDEGAIDARESAAVAVKSLTICIMAFDYLAPRHTGLSQECRKLSEAAARIKEELRERIKPARAA